MFKGFLIVFNLFRSSQSEKGMTPTNRRITRGPRQGRRLSNSSSIDVDASPRTPVQSPFRVCHAITPIAPSPAEGNTGNLDDIRGQLQSFKIPPNRMNRIGQKEIQFDSTNIFNINRIIFS